MRWPAVIAIMSFFISVLPHSVVEVATPSDVAMLCCPPVHAVPRQSATAEQDMIQEQMSGIPVTELRSSSRLRSRGRVGSRAAGPERTVRPPRFRSVMVGQLPFVRPTHSHEVNSVGAEIGAVTFQHFVAGHRPIHRGVERVEQPA